MSSGDSESSIRIEQYSYEHREMTIGLMSDSHGFVDPRVQQIMTGCDLVLHAGDVMDDSSVQAIRDACHFHAVAGNNDLTGPNGLPEVVRVSLPGGQLAIEHGHRHGWREPDLQRLAASHEDARAILYGHTHKMLLLQDRRPWILNPGACGRTRTQGGPRCLVMTTNGDDWTIEEFVFEDR